MDSSRLLHSPPPTEDFSSINRGRRREDCDGIGSRPKVRDLQLFLNFLDF